MLWQKMSSEAITYKSEDRIVLRIAAASRDLRHEKHLYEENAEDVAM